MVSRAVRLLGVEPEHKVADFFCGLGNFTLPLATCASHVTGIEGSDALVARARQGAADNGLAEKTDFVARNLFTWCDQDWEALWKKMGGIDRVLIDPPREGALALSRVLAATDKRPARIVYVSCNPATLARDCAILHHEGGWHIRAAGIMKERATFITDLWDLTSFFFVAPAEYEEKQTRKYWKGQNPEILRELRSVLAAIDDFSLENTERIVHGWIEQKGYGMGQVMNTLRLALVGAGKGPGMYDVTSFIGKEETLRRIDHILATLKPAE